MTVLNVALLLLVVAAVVSVIVELLRFPYPIALVMTASSSSRFSAKGCLSVPSCGASGWRDRPEDADATDANTSAWPNARRTS